MINFTLTQDQLALQNNVREFATKEILPLAWFYDEANQLPKMKSKNSTEEYDNKKIKDSFGENAWRCKNCREVNFGNEPPDKCPYCLFPNQLFEKVEEEK